MADFFIKQGDTAPSLVVQLYSEGAAVNLTNAEAATFKMRPKGSVGSPTVSAVADITSAANGEITYDWVAGDTDDIGTYNAEWEIEWADGTFETYPSGTYVRVRVVDNLDA